jgi:hypothetical protein
MKLDPGVEAAIRKAAEEDGVDPATSLAYAERESSFNPASRASKSMLGLYSMRGDLRQKYGMGDSLDPYEQTKAFHRLLADNKADMGRRLGRDVTDTEAYYGHHFGAGRAARMIKQDPNTTVDQVFTPTERAQNPHFDTAGTVGNLLSSVGGDIDKRRSKYGSDLDFSQFAEAANWPPDGGTTPSQSASAQPLDFSQFGAPV